MRLVFALAFAAALAGMTSVAAQAQDYDHRPPPRRYYHHHHYHRPPPFRRDDRR